MHSSFFHHNAPLANLCYADHLQYKLYKNLKNLTVKLLSVHAVGFKIQLKESKRHMHYYKKLLPIIVVSRERKE